MPNASTSSSTRTPVDPRSAWAERASAARDRSVPPRSDDLVPPPRFGATRFEAYRIAHPSQAAARDRVRVCVAGVASPPPSRRSRWRSLAPWRRRRPEVGSGLYLDGGFGVGKTHLLAAAWHAAPLPTDRKRYLSFQDLVHRVGVLGRDGAREAFAGTRLLCLDEFELDDPGNTLIIATFLANLFEAGATVLTTSNTPPDRQGEGRFAADDFRREILGIADRFEAIRIDGPDHRAGTRRARWSSDEAIDRALRSGPEPVLATDGADLARTLASLHPARYARLLQPAGTLAIQRLRPIEGANEALRFVHFVDKAYDLGVRLRVRGEAPLEATFDPSYASGAWSKKYDRCLSRLSEMLQEPLHAP
ncbi:MAG: cell division protein ZapE [Trueperaceae bacterium]